MSFQNTAMHIVTHIARTRYLYLLDNREFIVGGGTQPNTNTEPSRGEGLVLSCLVY